MKKRNIILIICIIGILLILINLRLLGVVPTYKTKDIQNYNRFINEELAYSDIFPEQIADDVMSVEFTYAEYNILLWDDYLCYLDIEYTSEEFEAEVNRISNMCRGMELKYFCSPAQNDILYTDDYFVYPAYVECLDNTGSGYYSYALIDEEEYRIIYIYINGIDSRHISFNKEYLPKGYTEKGDAGGYSEVEYSMYD